MDNQKSILFWLVPALIFLVAITAIAGVFFYKLTYGRETLSWGTQGFGQDIIDLFIVVPILSVSLYKTWLGSKKAHLVLLGTLLYILYSYMLYALYLSFGPFFLLYTATFGLSFFSLLFGIIDFDKNWIKNAVTEKTPIQLVSRFLTFFATIFALLWLKGVVSAYLTGLTPADIIATGLPTNPVWVLDLSILLPAFFIVANLMKNRFTLGIVLAPVCLMFAILMGINIISMIITMSIEGVSDDLASSSPILIIIGLITAVSAYLLYRFLGSLKENTANPAAKLSVTN